MVNRSQALRRVNATLGHLGQSAVNEGLERQDCAEKPAIAEEASMYSSRQMPMFSFGDHQLEDTNIKIDKVEVYPVPFLGDVVKGIQYYPNRFVRTRSGNMVHDTATELTYNQLIKKGDAILMDIARREGKSSKASCFVRAGPRADIIFAPGEARAAIVTCGGLCPGLNDVVAELFNTLYYNYGVDDIYGIRNGFKGFWGSEFRPWDRLTPEKMRGISELGGSYLGSARGGYDAKKIIDSCLLHGVNLVFIIGGDGTHRAATKLAEYAINQGVKMAVAGIPKTIDNDIGVIDRSFGFNTAVAEAKKAIRSAVVEAGCTPNGVGIVQLMGRHAGYIAAHATLASREVDVCLIPEIDVPLEGPDGFMQHLQKVLRKQGHAVVVVAEGAGENLLGETSEVDAGGNRILPPIGRFLSDKVKSHFKKLNKEVSIKYHDPSYMVRSVPADAADSIYCQCIAQNAVHGAMAGYTAFTSGLVNNRTVLLPMKVVTATSPSFLNPLGRTWERVLSLTHQPKWPPKEIKKPH